MNDKIKAQAPGLVHCEFCLKEILVGLRRAEGGLILRIIRRRDPRRSELREALGLIL